MASKAVQDSKQPDYSVKCMFFFKRRPDQTPEQCWAHWRDVHAGLVVPWMIHHGFINYQQVELQGKITPDAEYVSAERQDFDGIAVFDVPSFETLEIAFGDAFYKDVIAKDVPNFTDANGLFENGIITRYTGKMTTPIVGGKSTIPAEEGWKLWEGYHAGHEHKTAGDVK